MITIRQYLVSDRHSVIALWSEVFGNPPDHNSPEHSLDRKVNYDDSLLYVAEDGNDIIGTVMGGYDGHRGWVYSLAVHPAFRRQGVATKLMQHLEIQLQELGCPKLNLQVRASNLEVLHFYESIGYIAEERTSMGKRLGS